MKLLELRNSGWFVVPFALWMGRGSVRIERGGWLARVSVFDRTVGPEPPILEGVPLELEVFARHAAVAADRFPHIHIARGVELVARPLVVVPVDAALQIPQHLELLELRAGEPLELDCGNTNGLAASLFCGEAAGDVIRVGGRRRPS